MTNLEVMAKDAKCKMGISSAPLRADSPMGSSVSVSASWRAAGKSMDLRAPKSSASPSILELQPACAAALRDAVPWLDQSSMDGGSTSGSSPWYSSFPCIKLPLA